MMAATSYPLQPAHAGFAGAPGVVGAGPMPPNQQQQVAFQPAYAAGCCANAVGHRPQAFMMQPGAGMQQMPNMQQQMAGRMMAPNGMAAEGQPPWGAGPVNGSMQQMVSPAGEAA